MRRVPRANQATAPDPFTFHRRDFEQRTVPLEAHVEIGALKITGLTKIQFKKILPNRARTAKVNHSDRNRVSLWYD